MFPTGSVGVVRTEQTSQSLYREVFSVVDRPGIGISVSEIESCTRYVGAERRISAPMLRFVHAKSHFSDTLVPCRLIFPVLGNLATPFYIEVPFEVIRCVRHVQDRWKLHVALE